MECLIGPTLSKREQEMIENVKHAFHEHKFLSVFKDAYGVNLESESIAFNSWELEQAQRIARRYGCSVWFVVTSITERRVKILLIFEKRRIRRKRTY
jgi:uncharacterized protein YutD